MGRPLKKANFGANANSNIKVQFHNGTSSVPGYIVKQYGSRKFKCADSLGTTTVCKLVDKLSGTLAAGEMTITLKSDTGYVEQAVKIAKNLATVVYTGTNVVTGGTHSTGIYGQVKWSYSTSTSDTYWQIEEAGTNTFLQSATNLEGDDDANADYPIPGSGTYLSTATAFSGVSYALRGSTATVTGGITTVSNAGTGILRKKYSGNWMSAPGASTSTWNTNFFSTATFVKAIADTDVSWGNQTDTSDQRFFSCEWKGYVKVPVSQNYNFYGSVDDDMCVWIGNDAVTGNTPQNSLMYGSNKTMPGSTIVNANSVYLDSTKWYPVRIWSTEFDGGSKMQIFAIGADGSTYNGQGLQWAYNSSTQGF